MNYPILEVPLLSGSLLIAGVAIVHVVIAHFAVGAGLFNAVHETLALRRGDATMLAFLRRHTRFLILFSFVAGAVTGVGIWFTIALVAPRATSNLIHLFVWAWATEWVFFVVEIVAGYVYYYTWDRMEPRKHAIVGWVYAASAFASLVLINGIISFMLTPPADFAGADSFWINLFNPSFWPSLVVRSISCVSLVAIFAMIVVNYVRGFTREQRHHVIRQASWWLLPLVLMPPLALWYFEVSPQSAKEFIFGQSAIAMVLLFNFGLVASLLIAAYAFFGLIKAKRYINGESALMLLALAFIATGSMEFVREGIRKPFVIQPAPGAEVAGNLEAVYSTGLSPAQLKATERDGTLAPMDWKPGDPWKEGWSKWYPPSYFERFEAGTPRTIERGRAVFAIQCMACHTADGAYNPVAPLVKGWQVKQYAANFENLHATNEAMPHYQPTPDDRLALGTYLRSLTAPEGEDLNAWIAELEMTIGRAELEERRDVLTGPLPRGLGADTPDRGEPSSEPSQPDTPDTPDTGRLLPGLSAPITAPSQ